MKYLLISHKEGNISALKHLSDDKLQDVKATIQDGHDRGIIEASYALVGGGSVWIVNADSNASLARGLRKLGIHNVEVSPIVEVLDLIDGHLEGRAG